MPLFSTRKDTQSAAGITHRPVDLQRLLAVYDDYPQVLGALDSANIRLENAEEATRLAYQARDDAEKDLTEERKGRKLDSDRAEKAKEEALKLAKKEKSQAEKDREEKIRKDLEPKIKDLTEKLKNASEQRDKYNKELIEKRLQMEGWIKSMEKLSLERKLGYEREKKAMEERWESEMKTNKLDEEILEGLRKASKPVEVDNASIKSTAKSVAKSTNTKKVDGI